MKRTIDSQWTYSLYGGLIPELATGDWRLHEPWVFFFPHASNPEDGQ
jgi:hypothetical protein